MITSLTRDYTEDEDVLPWNHMEHPMINDLEDNQDFDVQAGF